MKSHYDFSDGIRGKHFKASLHDEKKWKGIDARRDEDFVRRLGGDFRARWFWYVWMPFEVFYHRWKEVAR